MKVLEIGLGNDFLEITPEAQQQNQNQQVRLQQARTLLHSQRNHQQSEKAAIEWEKILIYCTSDEGLISIIHTELT